MKLLTKIGVCSTLILGIQSYNYYSGRERMDKCLYKMLADIDALVLNGHFVYSTGKHGSVYIDKNKIFPHTFQTETLCTELAIRFVNDQIDAVIGPASGGIVLSQGVARILSQRNNKDVLALHADKVGLNKEFAIKRNYDLLIKGKKILIVEDSLLTGSSVKKVIDEVYRLKGNIAGMGVLFNKANLSSQNFNVPRLESLFNINLKEVTWEEESCPLCVQEIPINTKLGQGKNFLSLNKK